jgi:hypothetical protein
MKRGLTTFSSSIAVSAIIFDMEKTLNIYIVLKLLLSQARRNGRRKGGRDRQTDRHTERERERESKFCVFCK